MVKLMNKTKFLSLFCVLFLSSYAFAVHAEDGVVDILPTMVEADSTDLVPADTATHPAIRMTPDKSELIKLEIDAATVVVGNPAHINVIADSSKTLVLVPRLPGATYVTVLGKKGQVIMQRHVIVASPQKDYIRVKRTCTDDAGKGCQQTSVFYCPDMCHEIAVGVPQEESTQSDASKGNEGNLGNDSSSDEEEGEPGSETE